MFHYTIRLISTSCLRDIPDLYCGFILNLGILKFLNTKFYSNRSIFYVFRMEIYICVSHDRWNDRIRPDGVPFGKYIFSVVFKTEAARLNLKPHFLHWCSSFNLYEHIKYLHWCLNNFSFLLYRIRVNKRFDIYKSEL